ncbi:MAG TPA: hypothetical protein PKN48_04200 [Bacteroidales bacterium]|nr:hypothetical protein [Bacteroidales bacterium]
MDLTKKLKRAGYDLIDGPVRNHKMLQLWLKKPADRIEMLCENVSQVFKSSVKLVERTDPALTVTASDKDDYGFYVGISVLEDILQSLNIGEFDISANIKKGKNVTIAYDKSITKICDMNEVRNYLYTATLFGTNPAFLDDLYRDRILIITGIIYAKKLSVEIETKFELDAGLVAKINELAEGKLGFTMDNKHVLKMVSSGNSDFPVAVKANRILFDKGKFKDLNLVSDDRDFF